MEDELQLIEAYLDGARRGQVGRLFIDGDTLMLDGQWHAAFRLSDDSYIVQIEPPTVPSDVIEHLCEAFLRRDLQECGSENPLIHALTYAELDTIGIPWMLWGPDVVTGEAALLRRAVPEDGERTSAPRVSDDPALGDISAAFAASMRNGIPTSVVLAVGLDADTVAALADVVPDCNVQARRITDAVAACGIIVPHLVIVNAADDAGRKFLLEFRAEACGRFVPILAVTSDAEVPMGADKSVDPRVPPAAWQEQLVAMLP